MPAKRRRPRDYKKKKRRKKSFLIPVFVFLTFGLVVWAVFATSHYWVGKNKLSIAIAKKDGSVVVSTFDPVEGELVNLTIPKETEVELSRRLGKIRIKNAWQVGLNEGYDGELLAETITRHFKFPVAVWADSPAAGFTQSNINLLIRAMFSPYKTNLTIGDRVRLGIFSMGIKNLKKEDIALQETTYLRKTQLVDGREGYVVTGRFPQSLLVVFSEELMSNSGATVVITDETGSPQTANELGQLIEVLGAKVASIEKKGKKNYDCRVSGKDKQTVARVSLILSCGVEADRQSNFDIRLSIGEEFAQRF